jgi:gluconate 2-dehydrogenase gamma chain
MADTGVSRRRVLSSTALASSLLALRGVGLAQAHTISGKVPWTEDAADPPQAAPPGAYQFLSAAEAAFVDAAVARLIPADDLGPGAKEAGVTVFIDRQLAGPYGNAERWYMQGPWSKGTSTQGYQLRLSPAQLYRTAIKAIDDYCRKAFGGKAFHELSTDDQDGFLSKLEKGDVELQEANGMIFFDIFLQNTIEGFFSDPIYGGNRDMVGWKLIGFPGARYDYREFVSKHNQKLDLQPVGLKGRPGWNPA